jgi:uncharacterized membrane protein
MDEEVKVEITDIAARAEEVENSAEKPARAKGGKKKPNKKAAENKFEAAEVQKEEALTEDGAIGIADTAAADIESAAAETALETTAEEGIAADTSPDESAAADVAADTESAAANVADTESEAANVADTEGAAADIAADIAAEIPNVAKCKNAADVSDTEPQKSARALKTNRGFIKFTLLSLITLGIYALVFWSKFAKDANVACAYDGKKTRGIWLTLLFSLLTLGIYALIWDIKLASRVIDGAEHYNVKTSVSMSSYLLWKILGLFIAIGPIVAYALLFKTMNRVCKAYNQTLKAEQPSSSEEFVEAELEPDDGEKELLKAQIK